MANVGLLIFALVICHCLVDGRVSLKMDYDWKFFLTDSVPPQCPANTFPINMNGLQCFGLSQATASNADECARQCCGDPMCETYQWCPTGTPACSPVGSCWVGSKSDCSASKDWISMGRNVTPPVNNNCDVPYCQPNFDDQSWRNLNIPHDFVVEGVFSQSQEGSHGYLPKGLSWYRKHFTVDASYKGKAIWIYFEGVYRNSVAYLNGINLGTHASGYTSFYYNVADVLNYGSENLLAVQVDARHDEGWWYEGGGIYRHVWLHVADPLHVAQWGVYAPSTITGSISFPAHGPVASSADVSISTLVVNGYNKQSSFTVLSQIFDAGGAKVGQASSTGALNAMSNGTITHKITLTNVQLWDVTNPYLFRLSSTIQDAQNSSVDQVDTTIGVRTFRFDKDNGLFLNEIPVKIKGFCNHQDFAGVGVALPRRVNEFRVTKLQEMGANGWRMSHNPPNEELLDLTDQHGMLVWDENRNLDDTPQYRQDVAVLPLRDRNHPSIIIWSLCNEGGCQEGANDANALRIANLFKTIINQHDTTRPISGAWNSDLNDLLNGWGPKVMDLQGVNYNYGELDPYHKQYPNKPMIASETASCTGARGIYTTNDAAAHKSIFTAHGCAKEWWTSDATRSFMAGGFAWTGFDYKGEPTPYQWPCVNSNFGVIDIAGFPKDTFWYYQSWWINKTVLHVFPHWNKPDDTANSLSVTTCSSTDKSQDIKFTGSGNNPGQLMDSNGLCLDATCSDVTKGCEPLIAKPCTNAKSQQYVYKSDKSFSSVDNGGCIDLWDSGVGPGVGVYSCDGGSNQHWDVSGTSIKSEAGGNRCLTTGTVKPIWVYSNADSVELFINGESKGKQQMPYLDHVEWATTWTPGNIKVVAYDKQGTTIGSETIETTGDPAAIKLEVEYGAEGIYADRQDAALITATIVDSMGRTVPTASNKITFSVTGAGSLLGVGNGDPSCHEPDKGNSRSAFNGLARVLVQASNMPGTIDVQATAEGLTAGKTSVKVVQPPNPVPFI